MAYKKKRYYLVGSWIPTLGEIDFSSINKEYLGESGELNCKNIKNTKLIFHQLAHESINKIEIKSINNSLYGEINDINIECCGYWCGKMILFRNDQSEKDEFFSLLLQEIGDTIKEYYHSHIFHDNEDKKKIHIEYKEISKDIYNNKNYKMKEFKDETIFNILCQYNRKFDNYKTLLIESKKCEFNRTFELIIQIKGELLFYESFNTLFNEDLVKIIEKCDNYTNITNKYVDIMYNMANYYNSQQIVDKSTKLSKKSIGLGLIGIFVSIIAIIISVA